MIATDHPLVAQLAAGQARDNIVGGRELPIELNFQMHHRGPGPEMISERQRATKRLRCNGSTERFEQWRRVGIGDRQHRNFRDGLGFFARQPLRVLGGANAGSQRIARIHRRIQHAAALRTIGRPPAALRIRVALIIAVVARVGINQTADRAVFSRNLRLDASPGVAIAGDDDLPFDVDAAFSQRVVVGRKSIVDVDQRRGDVAVDGVSVVDRELILAKRRMFCPREERVPPAWRRSAGAGSSPRAEVWAWETADRKFRWQCRSPRIETARQ